jgi:hypothetical protein
VWEKRGEGKGARLRTGDESKILVEHQGVVAEHRTRGLVTIEAVAEDLGCC